MATVINSIGIEGLKGYPVHVEVSVLDGISSMSIVGLGDLAVKEAKDRIEACIHMLGYEFPKKRIIVNLSPSEIKKKGTYFDLPMLVGILIESAQMTVEAELLERFILLGEVSTTGELAHFNGALPMLIELKKQRRRNVIISYSCRGEVSLLQGLDIYPFETVTDVIAFLEKKLFRKPGVGEVEPPAVIKTTRDFSDIIGQQDIISYAVAAAAGNHNLLLVGTPGCGKSMLAKRMPSIMPPMNEKEVMDVTAIYSISGLLPVHQLKTERPFRSPHYNLSPNAMIGGGQYAMPGEITLAHKGILFLDEFPEFSRTTLESLRQPLEDKTITVSRVRSRNKYPADFLLVAAMNPCPCGHLGTNKCTCTEFEIKRYRQRISGPILDRIDIQKYMGKVDFLKTDQKSSNQKDHDLLVRENGTLSSRELQEKVVSARRQQQKRFQKVEAVDSNGAMESQHVKELCPLDSESTKLLVKAFEAHNFSARTYHKIIKLGRTFADLDNNSDIRRPHIISALVARDLDREHPDSPIGKRSRAYHG